MLFAGQLAFAQAWQGKGDQKLQVGFNSYETELGLQQLTTMEFLMLFL